MELGELRLTACEITLLTPLTSDEYLAQDGLLTVWPRKKAKLALIERSGSG